MLLDYTTKNNRVKCMQKLQERRIVPKLMDEFDCATLLYEAGIKKWQWMSIQQCLKLFMDINKVGVNEQRLSSLGQDHSEITHGTFSYTDPDKPRKVKEDIHY